MKTPQEALRHHVTGAIERGEKQAIVERKAQHTPAPWYKSIDSQATMRITRTTGEVIATLDNEQLTSERNANARLIAAAPELLEALERLVDHRHIAVNSIAGKAMGLPQAISAIAKAKGE